jgi:large repetitive protein
MRKFVQVLLLASMIGALTGGVVGAGTADAHTGHVLTIHDATAEEGSGNTLSGALVSLHLEPAPELGEQVKVDFGTSALGATAKSTAAGDPTPQFPEDFAQTDGTMTFDAGAADATFIVPLLTDNADEADETFFVQLFNARAECLVPGTCDSAVTMSDSRAVVTIEDDDATPELSINNVSHDEGDGATTTAYDFVVTKSGGSGQAVTVDYSTLDNSATSADDFESRSGTLTFPASSPSENETQSIVVPVKQDTAFEATEAFGVKLSNAANASIADADGIGTISNDDLPPPPGLSVNDASIDEGGVADFTVTLASPPGPDQTATVDWAVQQPLADAATEGVDYVAASGSAVFTAGESEQHISIATLEDDLDEPAENFALKLSKPASAGTGGYTYDIARDTGVGTINDNDEAGPVTFDVADVNVTEGNAGVTAATFTVSKTGVSGHTATVDFATANGSATASDFVARTGSLSFGPADVSKTMTVDVKGDVIDEVNETFLVALSNATNGTLGDAEATGTITDNDPAPSIVIGNDSVAESSTKACTVTVKLSAPSSRDIWVGYSTANGTAGTGDYVTKSGAIGFVDGDTAVQIKVFAKSDSRNERNETFSVKLAGVSPSEAASFSDAIGKCTIIDND